MLTTRLPSHPVATVNVATHVECVCSAGVIQPTRISADGKPVPIEHVAELLEGLHATTEPADQHPPQSTIPPPPDTSDQNPRDDDSD